MRRAVAVVVALCAAWACGVQAQGYPSKPLRLVVVFPTGGHGPIDFAVRVLQPKMAELLGQPAIVDNRAGANGKHL